MRPRQIARAAVLLLMAALVCAPTAAYAGTDDECRDTCGGAAFSPAFSDSPVTLVICAVPDSCAITTPRK